MKKVISLIVICAVFFSVFICFPAFGLSGSAIVSVQEDAPVIEIIGTDTVVKGDQFDIDLTLKYVPESLPEDIYAADIIIKYDADLFEFEGCNKVDDKTLTCNAEEIETGVIRIVLSCSEKIEPDESMVKLTFTAKDVEEPTSGSIQVESASLGTAPSGLVVHADGDTIIVNIRTRPRIPGDINDDGVINVGDLAIASYYYAAEEGDPNWDAAKIADVNNNGKVDLEDLVFIALEMFK